MDQLSQGVGIRDRVPGIILKFGTGIGTQIQNLQDLGLGPGLIFEKSGNRDSDRDASKNSRPEPGLTIFFIWDRDFTGQFRT